MSHCVVMVASNSSDILWALSLVSRCRTAVTKIKMSDKKAMTLTGRKISSMSAWGLSLSEGSISSLITPHHLSHQTKAKTGPAAMSSQMKPTLTTLTTASTMSASAYITITQRLSIMVMRAALPVSRVLASCMVVAWSWRIELPRNSNGPLIEVLVGIIISTSSSDDAVVSRSSKVSSI